ncbi:hypothetical protein EV702DRAFT_1050212 [Suillus placidus]|uniref:Uncharacterized protein n=1 Tax=Suillus placidus TaxID=48579 RepID=A0A9P7CXB9_9AGAM|nr:hypothetical protein EV702DRAFT_1050212 [Suillus placidus]
MDYALCEASQHNMEGITRAITFYDINCQYNKHLRVQLARNGIAESGKAFDRLDEAAPAHSKTEWLARERIAQSSRLNDPAAMDEYEINIKKAPSKKEIELRLLEESNARNAAPSRRSVAMWISTGLAIEEAQIALLIEIDGFTQSALTHLGEGFDADDEPDDLNMDILDDLDDDPADFTETSDTWTNSLELTVIPLPSNLGVDRCRRCMGEDLIPLEMLLHEGQANDALHRAHSVTLAVLYRQLMLKICCSTQASGRRPTEMHVRV